MQDSSFYQATDANNRTLKLAEKPSTVLIAGKAGNMPANALFLFPEVTSMDLTLPKTDQGLGDFFSFIRPELDEKPRISQTASVEEIASRKADLVLTKATHFESIARKLDVLGIPNYTMNLESYADWIGELEQLGKLLKNTTRSKELISLYEKRMQPIREQAKSLSSEQRVNVLLLQGDRADNTFSYKIAPDDWMQTWMVETVGANPVWKGSNKAANGWSTISFEQIAAWDPDVIILVSYKNPAQMYVDAIYSSPIWAQLDAVKNQKVLAGPHDMMSYIQPVASWILGLQWLGKTLYPQQYENMGMEAEVASFYRDFYQLQDAGKLDKLVALYAASVDGNK
jgi:iron complex transport system substrate-binding protein